MILIRIGLEASKLIRKKKNPESKVARGNKIEQEDK